MRPDDQLFTFFTFIQMVGDMRSTRLHTNDKQYTKPDFTAFFWSNSSYLKNKNKIFKNGVLIVIVACSCSSILHWNPNRAKKRWWNHSYSTNYKAYYVGTKCVRDILIPFTIKTVVNYSQPDLKRPTKTDFKFTTDITDGFPV